MIKLLLSYGADQYSRNTSYGRNVIEIARDRNLEEIAQLMEETPISQLDY